MSFLTHALLSPLQFMPGMAPAKQAIQDFQSIKSAVTGGGAPPAG